MAYYDLSHLTQDESQNVWGPIQDDEALFLYSIIRGMRLKRILEIGGLSGYSAKNFLQALNGTGILYTVDIAPVPIMGDHHKIIIKSAYNVVPEDVDNLPLEMVFFDCHDYGASMVCYKTLHEANIITDKTVLVLHDTHVHPRLDENGELYGFVHQQAERDMVNTFFDMGYHIFNLHTDLKIHTPSFQMRHGVTICQKSTKF